VKDSLDEFENNYKDWTSPQSKIVLGILIAILAITLFKIFIQP
jgi:hypothetical protein